MVLARRPSAYVLALLASPLAVLALVGWTRLALPRVPPVAEPSPALGVEALAVLAVERLWTAFDVERGADTGTLAGFRAWLDARGVTAGAPVEALHEGPLDGPTERLFVQRVDRDGGVDLAFTSAAEGTPTPADPVPIGAWSVTRRTWEGAGYALLGRELGCALCHVTVRPVERAGLALPRVNAPVQVGALGDLILRSDARVDVHGTLHLGGALLGADRVALAPEACPQLRFAALDVDLRLQREAAGPLALAPLEAMDRVRLSASEGELLGRQRGAPRRLRRALPALFPGFDDVLPTLAEGAPRAASRGLAGGRGGSVPVGAGLDELDAGAPLTPMARVRGHLWAVGTSAQPLRLDGDVEIEGDLVIGGVVQGRGSLRARGVVVVVGSLRVDGHLALVAGTDLLAGAAIEAAGPVRFVLEAQRAPIDLPNWITPERLTRMGDRGAGPLVLEAFCYAPGHVIVVAPSGPSNGGADGGADGSLRRLVHVRGGLVAGVVAVHAPGALLLEDDPETRGLLRLRAPLGLVLHTAPVGLPRSSARHAVTPAGGADTVQSRAPRGGRHSSAVIVKKRLAEDGTADQGSREVTPGPIESLSTDSPSARPTPDPR